MPDRVTKEPGIPDDIMHIADAIAANLPIGTLRQGFAANVIARAILAERAGSVDFRERLQAVIDWADLALAHPEEFNSHGVKNLEGPVFDKAREALQSVTKP